MRYQTKVNRHGAFWCVFVLRCGEWQRMRDHFATRNEARQARNYWSTA